MKDKIDFLNHVRDIISDISPEVFAYDKNEFWMIRWPYEYVEFYALNNKLLNTAIALPLARGLHDGTHRKSGIVRDGVHYRLPYVIHCLLVCRMLVDLKVPLSHEEEDIVLASALCHDMLEDLHFDEGGTELITKYHLDPRVYDTVRLVTKRKDFTLEEEQAHFHGIEANKLAMLVKLSDRSHNVEDLYNRSAWKVHEYIDETRNYFMPMCEYGLEHYPELTQIIQIFKDKIVSLTEASEILVDRCEAREQELLKQLNALKEENRRLRDKYTALWEG